ncbi:transposase (fragment) [Xenorhabdus bovienii SS-2004]|uniref:Transposase n=1 Tax=Xenorhabdus bovienii (strain SS-2004) TaxID=406818 RepID=D3V035_XENBS
MSHYRNFKCFYLEHVILYLHKEFPGLVSYTRMLTLKKRALISLHTFLSSRKSQTAGIAFIDSSKTGWFYGFKLHWLIDDYGALLAVKLTPGNTDDRQSVKTLLNGVIGHVYGIKGYLSQALCDELTAEGNRTFKTP